MQTGSTPLDHTRSTYSSSFPYSGRLGLAPRVPSRLTLLGFTQQSSTKSHATRGVCSLARFHSTPILNTHHAAQHPRPAPDTHSSSALRQLAAGQSCLLTTFIRSQDHSTTIPNTLHAAQHPRPVPDAHSPGALRRPAAGRCCPWEGSPPGGGVALLLPPSPIDARWHVADGPGDGTTVVSKTPAVPDLPGWVPSGGRY